MKNTYNSYSAIDMYLNFEFKYHSDLVFNKFLPLNFRPLILYSLANLPLSFEDSLEFLIFALTTIVLPVTPKLQH